MTRRTVSVVPHTHWDREWYAPYPVFRLRLVEMLDAFLPFLEHNADYSHFTLDGQMAMIEDYLEMRPHERARITRLAQAGRLSIGPWYILMDEFLVSGETIIRNLQLGLRKAAAISERAVMRLGYLPDMFGHIAQMPQILRLAGMDQAVVWRGVPAAVARTAFWWLAPDGSTVRSQYLPVGYGNGASTPKEARALVDRVRTHVQELTQLLTQTEPLLWMNGTDHQAPQTWLGPVLTEANNSQDELHFEIRSLPAHLADATRGQMADNDLAVVHGELRSGARTNVLMGVVSNRVDVRLAATRAEHALEQLAEPLCTLFLPASRWPQAELDTAWLEVIRNAAHDSICACSHDDVVRAVLHRYAEATAIAEVLTDRALDAFTRTMHEPGSYIVNPSPFPRSGLVDLVIPGEPRPGETLPGCQVLSVRPTELLRTTMKASELAGVLGQIRSQQFGDAYVNHVDVRDTESGFDIVMDADAYLHENLLVDEIKRDLYARAKVAPDAQVTISITQPPSVRVLARAPIVPGYGWARWEPVAVHELVPVTLIHHEADQSTTIDNGMVALRIDHVTGTFGFRFGDGRLVSGLGQIVDEGDHGDTYNYSPPDHDLRVDTPDSVDVVVVDAGPLRAVTEVRRMYRWPSHIDDATSERVGMSNCDVVTELEVRTGEAFVRVRVSFDNQSRDHRVRLILPLPDSTDHSRAECAFSEVTRPLDAEGGPTEHPLATFPARRWVSAGGLTVGHDRVTEYEIIDGGRAIALTLLRATGMLSRVQMTYRPLPAGPPDRLEGPQMRGPISASFAIAPAPARAHNTAATIDPNTIDAYAMVDDAFMPLFTRQAQGGGSLPPQGSALALSREGSVEVSSLRRVDGTCELRTWNAGDQGAHLEVATRRGTIVNLVGDRIEGWSQSFDIGPHKIVTAQIDDPTR